MNCQSCGMPMDKLEDHGGGDANNPFCKYCTDEQGNLMPREQVREKMIQFYIQKQGKTQEEAEKATDQLMGTMPAWKGEEAAAPTEPTAPLAEEPKPKETTEPPPGSAPGPMVEPTAGASVPEPTAAEPVVEEPTVTPEPEEETPTE